MKVDAASDSAGDVDGDGDGDGDGDVCWLDWCWALKKFQFDKANHARVKKLP